MVVGDEMRLFSSLILKIRILVWILEYHTDRFNKWRLSISWTRSRKKAHRFLQL
jgi:hypothetical protein